MINTQFTQLIYGGDAQNLLCFFLTFEFQFQALARAFEEAEATKGKATCILAKTFKVEQSVF